MSNVEADIPGIDTYARYDTKAGDSTASISKRFNVPWKKIWESPNNDDFRTALGRWLGRNQGPNVVVIPDPNPPVIPPGLTLWIPIKHVNLVQPPAIGRPYQAKLPFHRETLASQIFTPAESHTDFFELRIILPLYVEGLNPPDSSGKVHFEGRNIQISAWTGAELERFKQDVKKKAETYWNNRFRLWPPNGYPYFNWPTAKGAATGVNCTMEIRYADAADGNCLTVHAYKRSLLEAHVSMQTFDRMNSSTWTSEILQDQTNVKTQDNKGDTVISNSNTTAHEFGHLLGLSHSAGKGDTPVDYGAGGERWVILNIMGYGDQVNKSNAVPWLRHIYWHTGVAPDNWTVHTLDTNGNPLYL